MANFEGERKTTMTCAEFQRALPYIFESGGKADEEEHLRGCAVCSGLVQDLKYIAEQAKLLLPMRDPSPTVWAGIQQSLEREGLVRPSGNMVRLRPEALKSPKWSWTAVAAVAALVLVGIALLLRHNQGTPQQAAVDQNKAAAPATSAVPSASDQEVVRAVAERSPDLRATYENSLRDVNDYIQRAQKTVDENPDDLDANEQLMRAYQQKAMLYDMALTRATE